MSIELKIKSKHLSEEARIIRFEERKIRAKYPEGEPPAIWHSIQHHRRWDVRNENRSTFLARAYLAGKKYNTVERNADNQFFRLYIAPRILSMVNKYGKKEINVHEIYRWAEEK